MHNQLKSTPGLLIDLQDVPDWEYGYNHKELPEQVAEKYACTEIIVPRG